MFRIVFKHIVAMIIVIPIVVNTIIITIIIAIKCLNLLESHLRSGPSDPTHHLIHQLIYLTSET